MTRHIPLSERLATRRLVTPSGCWEYLGSRTSLGYGVMNFLGRRRAVHRMAYEFYVGAIPEGLDLDHLCRNPPCFNPEHLEPVTHRENMARGIHRGAPVLRTGICQRGHAMTPESTYVPRDGRPRCRACRTINQQELRAKKALALAASSVLMTRDDWAGAWRSACTSAFFCALIFAWPVGRAIALTHGGF